MLLKNFEEGKFRHWAEQRGAEILSNSTQWEVLRFRCEEGYAVAYRKSDNTITMNVVMLNAHNAFRNSDKWNGTPAGRIFDGIKSTKGKKGILLKRDGTRCFYCGKHRRPDKLTIEHLVPKTCGGTNHVTNLVLACLKCNNHVGIWSVAEKIQYRESLQSNKSQDNKSEYQRLLERMEKLEKSLVEKANKAEDKIFLLAIQPLSK